MLGNTTAAGEATGAAVFIGAGALARPPEIGLGLAIGTGGATEWFAVIGGLEVVGEVVAAAGGIAGVTGAAGAVEAAEAAGAAAAVAGPR